MIRGSGSWRAAGAAIAAYALLCAPAVGAAKKPDLVVKAVTSPPAEAYIGEDLPVEVTVQNKGKKAAKASKLGVGLSSTTSLTTPPDIELPNINIPALKPKKTKTVTGNVAIADDESPRSPLYLLTCADRQNAVKESKEDNNCKASAGQTSLKYKPTTYQLIDAELQHGDITLAQALLFKTYAEAGDSRLPERFGTPPDDPFDSGDVTKQVAARFAGLADADKEALDPFYRPPIYQGAYFSSDSRKAKGEAKRDISAPLCAAGNEAPQLAAGWDSLTTTHFRIHYYTQKPYPEAAEPSRSLEVAQQVAGIAEYVYGEETPVFGTPLSDAGVPCNGGDGLIDIYAAKMRPNKIAQVLPYLPGYDARPGWMFINLREVADSKDVRDVFAHEFSHLCQLRYDYAIDPQGSLNIEYGWLEEATATWAIDYVYPVDDYEWRFLSSYFGYRGWTEPIGETRNYGTDNGYRDYLFFLFQTKDTDSTAAITSTFQNAESMGSVQALNQALGGNFATRFKDFALETLNRGDHDGFQTWDGITEQLPMGSGLRLPDYHVALNLNGQPMREVPIPGTTENYSGADPETDVNVKSFDYTQFELPDSNVRKLTFKKYGWRPDSGPDATSKITAWFKTADGQYHEQDWSSGADKILCRDRPAENITELVLFYTNGRPTPYLEGGGTLRRPVYQQGKVELKDQCDPVPYDVTFTGSSRRQSPQQGGIDYTTEFHGTMRVVPTAGISTYWTIASGTLVVDNISGDAGQCTIASDVGTFALPASEQANAPMMYSTGGQHPTYGVNTPWVINNPPYQIGITLSDGAGLACDEEEHDSPVYGYGQWITRTPTMLSPAANGTLHGVFHVAEDQEWTHDLDFTLVPDYD